MKDCRIRAIAAGVVADAIIITAFWFLSIAITPRDYSLYLLAPGILVAGIVSVFAATLSRYLLRQGGKRRCSYTISLVVPSVVAGRVVSLIGFPQMAKVEPRIVRLAVTYGLYAGIGILVATCLHLIVLFAFRLFHRE